MRRKPKYTIEEIRQKVTPIAIRRGLTRVSLFGSYARNEARAKSDVDLLIYDPRNNIRCLWDLGGLYNDFEEVFDKTKVDIVQAEALNGDNFSKRILNDEVELYAEGT